jgi:hypothetical protein
MSRDMLKIFAQVIVDWRNENPSIPNTISISEIHSTRPMMHALTRLALHNVTLRELLDMAEMELKNAGQK